MRSKTKNIAGISVLLLHEANQYHRDENFDF